MIPKLMRVRRMSKKIARGLLVVQREAILPQQPVSGTSSAIYFIQFLLSQQISNRFQINISLIQQIQQSKQQIIQMIKKITYGTRQLNKLLDDTLMNKYMFPSQTLMEIAGLAVAQVANLILKQERKQKQIQQQKQQICVLVGPGNNGGDGLVAARHLTMMNYIVDVIVFKQLQGKNGIYQQLCTLNGIPSRSPSSFFSQSNKANPPFQHHLQQKTLIIDAIFGFPFTGEIRQPYRQFIEQLNNFQDKILSIDIPSGWDANQGNIHKIFTPKYLISLGMPKKCSENFKGDHYFGGRFVPQSIKKQLNIELPQFDNDSLYCKL